MQRYQVTHKSSRETWEVEAGFSEDALQAVGWNLEECQVLLLREGQFAQIVPPKVAVQVIPPKTGSVPICPDCNVTLTRQDGQDFWWMCPACDLVYHELENQFFSAEDLP